MNSGDDQIDALYSAISSLNQDGYSACKVRTEVINAPVSDPDTGRIIPEVSSKGEKVWVECGQKSVLVVKMKTGIRVNEDVMEQPSVPTFLRQV